MRRRVSGNRNAARVQRWLRKRYINYTGSSYIVGRVIRASNNLFDLDGTASVVYEYFNGASSVGTGASHTTAAPGSYHIVGTHTDGRGNVTTKTSNIIVIG